MSGTIQQESSATHSGIARRTRLIAAFRRIAPAFAEFTQTSVGLLSPEGDRLAVVGGTAAEVTSTVFPVTLDTATLAFLEVTADTGKEVHPARLESLAALLAAEAERIEDEEALLAELSASWESLQAVYDLNADFSTSKDPKSLLQRITERARAIHPNLQAVMWLEDGVILTPVAVTGDAVVRSRSRSAGLIGDALIGRRTVMFNEATDIRIDIEVEPELRCAKRIVIVPLATRFNCYGVLVCWIDTAETDFDSRMMRLVDTLALKAAIVIENDRLNREAIQNEKLKQEIDIGSRIQQTLLSGTPPKELNGISIAAASISSQKIDGDFYDFIEHGDDCFDLIVGDVMGKGIPAALVGAATKNSFLRAIGQLQAESGSLRPAPQSIVSWVNHDVTPKLMILDSFVTACYTRFDLVNRNITFVDCGHTKTIHYKHREGIIRLLEGDNLPLGFARHEIFAEQTVAIDEGDLLFFYSDGVTETKNPLGELFGDARLGQFIRLIGDLEPEKIISTLIENLFRFSTEDKFNDDLTCVVVRVGEAQPRPARTSIREVFDSRLDELGHVRQFARTAATSIPPVAMNETAICELELAVAEAFTNIVRHACEGRAGTPVHLVAQPGNEAIELIFSYDGLGFDPKNVPPPVFDGTSEGGFGLFIIEKSVDFVGYLTDKQNRHSIHLIKNTEPKQENQI